MVETVLAFFSLRIDSYFTIDKYIHYLIVYGISNSMSRNALQREKTMTESVVSQQRKRPYHSHVREQQAQETRQRILDAARPLFLSRGYAGTTVDAIAEAARLSPKTVNAVFGSKRGVFAELVRPSAFGKRYQQLLTRLQTDPDPQQRVVLAAS